VLWTAPEPGSEPLNAVAPFPQWTNPFTPAPEPRVITFGDRWSSNDPNEANALLLATGKFGSAKVSADATPAKK
jgi:hypothetical protein